MTDEWECDHCGDPHCYGDCWLDSDDTPTIVESGPIKLNWTKEDDGDNDTDRR